MAQYARVNVEGEAVTIYAWNRWLEILPGVRRWLARHLVGRCLPLDLSEDILGDVSITFVSRVDLEQYPNNAQVARWAQSLCRTAVNDVVFHRKRSVDIADVPENLLVSDDNCETSELRDRCEMTLNLMSSQLRIAAMLVLQGYCISTAAQMVGYRSCGQLSQKFGDLGHAIGGSQRRQKSSRRNVKSAME